MSTFREMEARIVDLEIANARLQDELADAKTYWSDVAEKLGRKVAERTADVHRAEEALATYRDVCAPTEANVLRIATSLERFAWRLSGQAVLAVLEDIAFRL